MGYDIIVLKQRTWIGLIDFLKKLNSHIRWYQKSPYITVQYSTARGHEVEKTDTGMGNLLHGRLVKVGAWDQAGSQRQTKALDPRAWYSIVCGGGCRFTAAWVKEEEKASEHRQRKREAEETGKVEDAPGVTLASLRRFRAALIGPTQGLPKRRRLCR